MMLELPDNYDAEAAESTLNEWFAQLNLGPFTGSGLDAQEQWRRLAHSEPERRGYYTGIYEGYVTAEKKTEA